MAIGSEAEIGVTFKVGVPISAGSPRWGPDLLEGYGTLHYPPGYQAPERKKTPST
jgi:hypothetical protein